LSPTAASPATRPWAASIRSGARPSPRASSERARRKLRLRRGETDMKLKIAVLASLLAAWCALCGLPTPPAAQVQRTWVSGVGDDVNPCSRTAPCRTFRGALQKAMVGGEVDCLDSGSFGTLVISKSITIECPAAYGLILHSGQVGITINFNLFANS